MRSYLRILTLPLAAALLVACGDVSQAPAGGDEEFALQGRGAASECEALYANSPSEVQVSSSLPYGEVGTLILSFLDDTTKAKAVDWMGAELGLTPGSGVGAFENLPMVAVKTLVSRQLVDSLISEFQPLGLVSIWEDAPLTFFLDESVAFIGADAAREAFGLTGDGVGVAVIDSGIDATHPDLNLGENVGRNVKIVGPIVEQPVGGYLYADLENTDLTSGHGTHVAGTIAGLGTASEGRYTGVAPGATLLGVGTGDTIVILYALQGFDFVLRPDIREEYGIRVISNSWGTSGRFSPYNPISLASKRAYDLGIITVFAAGNAGPGDDTLNPYSASPCVISVAAGDKQGMLADFSSRGIPGDQYHKPDITAPGVRITAARALTGVITPPEIPDAFYSTISGTSMATPHVSGTLALMLEANPSLNLDGALDILEETARPMFDASGDPHAEHEVGAGYLDAYEAVRLALKRNRDRYELTTDTLATWQGQVLLGVCPVVTCVVQSEDVFDLQVPEGLTSLRVSIEWLASPEDIDLYLYDPSGNLAASGATLADPEVATVVEPAAGTWKVVVRGYINALTDYSGLAEGDSLVRR
jgi:serine protease AprX